MRNKGFWSALLRCGEIKLIAEKREYAISDLIANIARTKRHRTNRSVRNLVLGPEQTFTTSPLKGFTSEVQLTQERNLYQKATVKQFTSEVNRPSSSLPSLFHHGVHFFHCSY